MIKFLLLIVVTGCAMNQKKEVDLDNISNKDFDKEKAQKFDYRRDFFTGVSSENAQALQDESLYRINSFDSEVKGEDVLTSIVFNCHKGNYDKAFGIIEVQNERYRENPSFWNQVGTCFLLKGERRKALMFYNKALEFQPNFAPALNNIGLMYRKEGNDQKAEVAFSKAVKNSNFSKTPRFNLAQLYLDYGLFNDAIKEFKVLEDSKDVDVFAGLGSAYLMAGDYENSIRYFKMIDEDFYEWPYIGINAALAFYKAGDKDEARDILDDIDEDKLGPYKGYYEESKKKVGL